MKHIFVFIFLFLSIEIDAGMVSNYRRRLRRQILPSQHIQVHSIDSKVSLDDLITVESTDSRLELSERDVNATIWSDKSRVQFDTYDTFVNATAETAQSIMNILNCVFIHGKALESTIFMTTNRTSDGHTYVNHQMFDNANVSITDEGVNVQGIGGRRIGVEAQTWERFLEKTMTLTAMNNPVSGERELMLTIVSPQYKVDVCFVGAMIYIEFNDKLIQIDPDFTNVNIYTSKYLVNFRTKDLSTTYDVKLTPEEIMIRCPQEQTTVFVQPEGVNVHVEEFSKMQIDRGGGEMTLSGRRLNADSMRVISLSALLHLANDGLVRADTTKSEILVQTPVQNVGLTAAHHDIRVFGGVPHLLVEAGLACVEVTASNGMPNSITLLPPFTPPADRYITIGPYQGPNNATASPVLFPEPLALNVTQSPLDGCGGFKVIPKNQTMIPPLAEGTTGLPVTSVTHEIVTYQTIGPNQGEQTTPPTPGMATYATSGTISEISTTVTTPVVLSTDASSENMLTVATTSASEGMGSTTVSAEFTNTTEIDVTAPVSQIPQELTTIGIGTETPITDSSITDTTTVEVPQYPTLISTLETNLNGGSSTANTEPTLIVTDEPAPTDYSVQPSTDNISTDEYPFPTDFPIFETSSTSESVSTESSTSSDGYPVPTPPELPIETSSEGATTEEYPFPTDFPIFELSTTTENVESGVETSTLEIPLPSDLPLPSVTTEGIPYPEPLPTDDFVIGHWFSTEESGERTTTEIPEIGITATIGSIGVVTRPTVEGDDIPTPPDIGELGGETTTVQIELATSEFPTPAELNTALPSETPEMQTTETVTFPNFPEPSQFGDAKMLILKMRVPDGVDVNSPDFTRNITASLRRLVRDTRSKLKKRIRRGSDFALISNETIEHDGNEENIRNMTTRRVKEDEELYPIRVNGIMKYHNLTQVTFTFEDVEITQDELEKALYELETNDLDKYFEYPTADHISGIDYEFEQTEEDYTDPVVLGAALTIIFVVVIVAAIYFIKKGETSKILQRMGRHFRKYTVPVHATPSDAFERQSV